MIFPFLVFLSLNFQTQILKKEGESGLVSLFDNMETKSKWLKFIHIKPNKLF